MEPYRTRLIANVVQALRLDRPIGDAIAVANLLHSEHLEADPSFADDPDQKTIGRVDTHVEIGAQICLWEGWAPEVAAIIRHHHEHHDGSGFPRGLSGDEIPIGSSVIGIGNAFARLSEGMSSPRTVRDALERIQEQRGRRFRPDVVDAFRRVIEAEAEFPNDGVGRSRDGGQSDASYDPVRPRWPRGWLRGRRLR